MKKIVLILFVVILGMSFNSCTSNTSNNGNIEQVVIDQEVIVIKREVILKYDTENKTPHKYIQEYNKDGYMTRQVYYLPDGEKLLDATFTLDENNNIVGQVNKMPTATYTYFKDDTGKWYRKNSYNSAYIDDSIDELKEPLSSSPYEDFAQHMVDTDRKNNENVPYEEYKIEYNEYNDYGVWVKCSLIKENDVVIIEREVELWGEPKKVTAQQVASKSQTSVRDSILKVNRTKDSLAKVSLEKKLIRLGENFNEKEDDFSDITWVEHIDNPKYIDCNACYLYFALRDGKPENLRFKFQYYAEDWLFIQELIFNADGEIFHIYPEKMKRDNDGGYIWEWYDSYIGNSSGVSEEFIKKLANSLKVKVKMVGSQYSKVRELTDKEISAISLTYQYYKTLDDAIKNYEKNH